MRYTECPHPSSGRLCQQCRREQRRDQRDEEYYLDWDEAEEGESDE